MGRQIEFFLTKADEILFLRKVSEYKYLIMDKEANIINDQDANDLNDLLLFITFSGSNIVKKGGGIDQIQSEVIELFRCKSWDENSMNCGRIWAEFKYWSSEHEYVAKHNQLNEMYKVLAQWIKKTMKCSICGHYFVGEQAYKIYKEKHYMMKAGPKQLVEFKLD